MEWLSCETNLRSQAGKSLAERVALFNRQFGAKVISIYKLRRIYRELGIKRNKLRLTKVMTEQTRTRVEEGIVSLKSSYDLMIQQGYEVVYLDEFVITSKTYQDRTWMIKNRPFEVDYRMNQVKPIAVILAVSVS